jgi:hypothetical protein
LDALPANLPIYVFSDPRARAAYVDWEAAAEEQVARLRAAEPRWGSDGAYRALLDQLLAVPEFASRWATHPVSQKHRGTKRLRHPAFGDINIAYEVFLLADDDQEIVTWRPADEASVDRFAAAATGPMTRAALSLVVS